MNTITIVLLTILGYSFISTIVLIVCVLNKLDEDTILSFVCGPVFWLFLIPAYLEDCFKSIKDKKYIYSEETYQRFLKMNWKMHRLGNVLLIKNRNSRFSLWGIRIIKNVNAPVEEPIDISKLRRKKEYTESTISEDIDEAQDYFG